MAKQKITDIVRIELSEFLKTNDLELYSCEYIKEGKDWFLNVYIDRPFKDTDKGIGTDECETVSRFLSKRLDELDPIEKNYYLVVSSPGMDRELITEEHYKRYLGEEVEIKLYKGYEGSKKYTGIMDDINDQMLTLIQSDCTYEIPRELIAKTKLAVKI